MRRFSVKELDDHVAKKHAQKHQAKVQSNMQTNPFALAKTPPATAKRKLDETSAVEAPT
jgi:hypothetical protein